jgi:hypothetical protein
MGKGYLSDEARRRLRWVEVPDEPVSLERFPDFLIVGPQRTGTTWIHENLRWHPQILWPEQKEIFFFSRLKEPGHPKFRSAQLTWYLELFRDRPAQRLLRHVQALRYFGRLYQPIVRGEATASYAAMDRDLVEEVVTLNPDVRAILMIRNPVERAWSHAKKDLVRNAGRKLADVDSSEFEAFFRDEYQRRCARYVANVDTWEACLAPGHLMVGKFEDVSVRPEALLTEVMEFLGVDSDARFLGPAVREAVNPTAGDGVPERYRRFLEELLADDIRVAERRFGVHWS